MRLGILFISKFLVKTLTWGQSIEQWLFLAFFFWLFSVFMDKKAKMQSKHNNLKKGQGCGANV